MGTFQLHISKLSTVDKKIAKLYEKFKTAILSLDSNIEEISLQNYITFRLKKNIVGILIQERSLKITLNAKYGTLVDAKNLFNDASTVKHHASGDYQVKIDNDKDLKYILSMVEQVIENQKI